MFNMKEKKPLTFISTEEFNARSENLWSQDTTNSQGSIIKTFTSTYAYHQLINIPIHK